MATFDESTVTAVLAHMNGDHPEDNLVIVQAFGDPDADSAVMTGLDGSAGLWGYTVHGVSHEVSVPWSRDISERPEIRREVVVVYNSACALLGIPRRTHD